MPVAVLINPWSALAQTADTKAQDITVLGQGLPPPPGTPAYNSITIDRDRITGTASGLMDDVLRDVAGFQQFRRSDSRSANPSAQGATLRALGGNASTRTLVMLDGVPMADPFFGYIPFSAIVPDRLSTIRVTRGGGVGAFGAGAVAGTIEMENASRADLPEFAGSAYYGSHDSSEMSAGFTPDLGSGFLSLSGRWSRGDGFQTTPQSQRVAATVPAAYDNWSVGVRAVVPVSSNIELQARGLVFRDFRTLRFAGADSSNQGQDASIRLVTRGPWKVDALAYVQARNFSNIVISSSSFKKTLDQRDTPSTGIGGKIEVRPPVGPHHVLRIGTDTRFSTGDMFEDAYLTSGAVRERRHAGGDESTTGFYIENDWTLGSLVLTGGARADRWSISNGFYNNRSAAGAPILLAAFPDRSGWKASFRAGTLLHVNDAMALRFAGYTGFRLPTLNELYRPFVVFPIKTDANANLKPEQLRGIEGGIELSPAANTHISATVFYNHLGDAIANVTLDPVSRQRQNVDAIEAVGIELTANAKLDDFSLSASYAYTDSKVKAPGRPFDGLRPAQTPRHSASSTFAWSPRSGPSASVTLRYIGKQYEDDMQTDVLPDAFTVDAVATLPLNRHFLLTVRGENLFDATVVTRNAGGSMDLGAPRILWIGARFAY
tara:strand:+ start:144 stop:2126 length:1983 start_codon:yes stop_codon:yes gene_type:complete